MEVELLEIHKFLSAHHPFSLLPEAELQTLPRKLSIRYFRRGSPFPPKDGSSPALYLLRRGAVELRDAQQALLSKLAEGDLYTLPCDPEEAPPVGLTVEDTLAYLLPCEELARLRAQYPSFSEYFDLSLRRALDQIKETPGTGTSLLTVQVGELLDHPLVSVPPNTTIREAAQRMTEARISSLIVLKEGRLLGMVTDRDLRSRCLAAGLSAQERIDRIMTKRLHCIKRSELGFQALLTMTRLNVHHLPVLDGDQVVGVISTSDLVRFQSANSVYLVGGIRKAKDLDALIACSAQVPELQVHLVQSGATADQIGQAVSAVTDAISLRLLEMAEAALGPPPVPYAWLAGGSQARREQSVHSDQDNALLIADHSKPEEDEYFAALARFVNDGLHACGYVYCPGKVMASNPKWRQPLRIWRKYFNTWIKRPEPMALMLSSVFFDLRAVHDPEGMFEELQGFFLESGRANRIFIAYLVSNALKHRPPLGFFRNFVLIRGGEHDHSFDLKHRGIVPIIDLARIYALSVGLPQVNTIERLRAGAQVNAVSQEGAANLIDALEFIGTLRMRHQARQLQLGEAADNYLHPEQLSQLERSHLKDAFSLIDTMQESLGQRYQAACFA